MMSGGQEFGRGKDLNRQNLEDFYRSENILYDTIMLATCHYTFFQTLKMNLQCQVNHNVNYELWMIIMCQCRFNCYK